MFRVFLVWFGLAFCAGALLPVQAGMNARLRDALGSPFRATLVNFLGGLLIVVLLVLLVRGGPAEPRQAPWWSWLGGLLGATLLTVTIILVPRLGAVALFAAVVAGQLTMAAVLDHFGLVGYSPMPFTASRALGIVLLVAGALLVLRR